jgi:hypothetical protein
VIARCTSVMILLGLVACATTNTQVSRKADPAFARKVVTYPTPVRAGTIVVGPGSHLLYLVQDGGQAIRYGVGVVALQKVMPRRNSWDLRLSRRSNTVTTLKS